MKGTIESWYKNAEGQQAGGSYYHDIREWMPNGQVTIATTN